MVLEALEKSGQRGLLAERLGRLEGVGVAAERLYGRSVPHDWLFPQMAAVVHHGGAGTTAAGLRAGKPTRSYAPSWPINRSGASLVYQRGVAPKPIPQRRLTAERLARSHDDGGSRRGDAAARR